MNHKNIFVTGAKGFVGKYLVPYLLRKDYKVFTDYSCFNQLIIGQYKHDHFTDWSVCLKDIDVLIHLAARVHVEDNSSDSLDKFRLANVEATINLAKQAETAGVKRFIYISSVKVLGDQSVNGFKASPNSPYAPSDPYAISKMEAERALLDLMAESKMEIVIIRPPLIYGRDVKGNFFSLIKIIKRGLPLPFASINNTRSFVSLKNFSDFVAVCVEHKNAANQIFMVSDGDDLSTSELIKKIARAFNVKDCTFKVPESLVWIFFVILGKKSLAIRLLGNLQVDITKNSQMLGWIPVENFDKGILDCLSERPDFE